MSTIFNHELISLKEEYLIKRNYINNVEIFKRTVQDFNSFQNLSIDFAEDNYMDAFKSGFQYLNTDSINIYKLYEQGTIGQVKLNDSIASLDYNNEQYAIESFKIDNSKIKIKLVSDTIIFIDKYWSFRYKGNCKSDLFPEILDALDMNTDLLEELKNQLRRRNCFGFSNNYNRISLHFRSPRTLKMLVCSYSYCIFKNNKYNDDFFEVNYDYGKLDEDFYWFFNDAIQTISLNPGGYEKREI